MVLYKYAAEDSGFRILEGLRLKITPPNEFNDPFEITPHSKSTRTLSEMLEEAKTNPESYRSVYEAMNRAGAFTDSFEKFIAGLPQALCHYFSQYKKLLKTELAKIDFRTPDTVSRGIGILCLSKLSNSIPMWSYYANHHRGVVYGLDINKIGGPLSGPCGFVKYRKHRVRVDPNLPPSSSAWRKLVIKTVFTKSAEWKHEQEYRRVFQLNNLVSANPEKGQIKSYFWDVSNDAIQTIIFGCRISFELENKIRQELQRRKRTFGHIQLFRCKKHNSQFGLEVIPTA
jgi:hypothetical protein